MKIILLWSFTVLYFSFAQYELLEKKVLNEDGITYSASLSGTSYRSRGGICALGDGSLERSVPLEFELSGDMLCFMVSRSELSAEYQQDLLGGLLDSGDSLHFVIAEDLSIDAALRREIGCSKPSLVVGSGLYPVEVFSDRIKGVIVTPNTHE